MRAITRWACLLGALSAGLVAGCSDSKCDTGDCSGLDVVEGSGLPSGAPGGEAEPAGEGAFEETEAARPAEVTVSGEAATPGEQAVEPADAEEARAPAGG